MQFLPLPELMPFRLTPQFTNLLLPHKVSGQLRSCMIHTLRALRQSPTILLNTMDVFIKEPSLEWEVRNTGIIMIVSRPPSLFLSSPMLRNRHNLKRLILKVCLCVFVCYSYCCTAEGNKWYPKEKVNICRRKLRGHNSANLML